MLALCLLSILIGWFSWRFIEKPFRKRDSVSKKNIFIFSLSGILIFSFLGSSIFINNGFAEIKYKKINEKLLNMGIIDFEFNNKKLQEQSWNILRTISNNESYGVGDNNYDLNHFSDLNSEKERILFVGNSHSKDLFNIFYYNIEINEKFEIARFGIQLHDIKSNFFETFSYKNSDVIIIISKYSEDDLKILYDLASKIANDNKKLFIVEELFHFPTLGGNTFSDRLIKQELSKSNVSLDELINKVNFEHTKYFLEKKSSEDWTIRNQLFNDISIKIKKDIPQVNFLNRMDYICPNNYCSVLTKTGNKIFYDYGHHTLKGALYFSRKINNTKFYKDLLIGLDKKMFLNSSPPITKEK